MADQEDGSSITVFVKGISFQVDDKQFEEAFADVGPIRTVFLVRKKGQDRHLGYGFVTYALLDDAKRAVEDMDGKQICGRPVNVSFAKRRAPLDERRQRDQEGAAEAEAKPELKPKEKPPAPKQDKPEKAPETRTKAAAASVPGTDKHRFVRTLALGGLTEGNRKAAIKKAKKAGKVEEIIDPAPEDVLQQFHVLRDGCPEGRALLVYEKAKHCTKAVASLHRAEVPGGDPLWARQLSGEGLHLKKWRVIVRNLPFGATADTLRAAMQAAGFVWDLNLPKRDDGKAKGFGFVTYTCKAHAEEAISALNGKKIAGRMVAVDWALAKGAYDQAAATAAAGDEESDDSEAEDSDDDDDGSGEDEESDGEEEEGEEAGEEVDEAKLQKERKNTLNLLDQMLEAEEGTPAAKKPGKNKEEKKEKSKKEKENETPKKKEKENEAPASKEEQTKAVPKKEKDKGGIKTPEAGQINGTVFLRGLHLDVTKMDLQLKMERFGAVKSCRLVVDKDTKKLKGTAFVDFETTKAAEKAVAASSKDRAKGVAINGIPVQINHALTQDGARALATQRSDPSGGKPGDKRNLHLSKEGVIERSSAAWDSMSQTDKAKRERAIEERNAKLKNPNMYCSTNRLLLRNVPKEMDDKGLKELCVRMVKERATKSKPLVKSCKILMDSGDGAGAPKSRGRGFIEFEDAEHALTCLRQMNNNPKAFQTASSRPIVEFAVEDARLKRKFDLKIKARQKTEDGEDQASSAAKKVEKKRQWKQRLREKIAGRKEAKEKQDEEGGADTEDASGGAETKKGSNATKGKAKKRRAETDESDEQQQQPPQSRKKPKAKGTGGDGKQGKASGNETRTASEAFKSAKVKRVKANAAMEEAHAAKKRKQDQAMDIIAQEGTSMYRERKKKKKKEATDKLDDLVGQYRKKLFGVGGGKQSSSSDATGNAASGAKNPSRLKKWFE